MQAARMHDLRAGSAAVGAQRVLLQSDLATILSEPGLRQEPFIDWPSNLVGLHITANVKWH